MKTLAAILLTLTCFVGCWASELTFLIGNEARVMQHCITNATDLFVYVSQNGKRVGRSLTGPHSFKTKLALDKFFQAQVVEAAKGATTNTARNRDGVYVIEATYSHFDTDIEEEIIYFSVRTEFTLTRTSTGEYKLPTSLRSLELGFHNRIAYKIPQHSWSRYEDGEMMVDTLSDPDLTVIRKGVIFVPLNSALSGNNVTIWSIRKTGSKLVYQVNDAMGNRRAENQPSAQWIPYAKSPGASPAASASPSLVLGIVNGEPGRTYEVLSASSIDGPWSTVDDSRHTFWPDRTRVTFQDTSEGAGFFRVRSVEDMLPVRDD